MNIFQIAAAHYNCRISCSFKVPEMLQRYGNFFIKQFKLTKPYEINL